MKVLVTGAAGFIGRHVAQALLARGDEIVGLDNLNDYYDVGLKFSRLDRLRGPGDGAAAHRVLNIGSHRPVPLMDFIGELERALGVRALLQFQPMQPGDVTDTCADVQQLQALTGQRTETPLRDGIERFVRWYHAYHPQALRRVA